MRRARICSSSWARGRGRGWRKRYPQLTKQWKSENETHEREFGKLCCGMGASSIKDLTGFKSLALSWILQNPAPRRKEPTSVTGKSSALSQPPKRPEACRRGTTITERVMPQRTLLTEAPEKPCSLCSPSHWG